VISSWNTRLLRARGLSTVIASTGTIWTSVAVVIQQTSGASDRRFEKTVKRVEAVGVEKNSIALGTAKPRGGNVHLWQKIIIHRLPIILRQTHGHGDIRAQDRIEPQAPAHYPAGADAGATSDHDRAGEFAVDRDEVLLAVARDRAPELLDVGEDLAVDVGIET
jgi:hypothetical protein